MKENGCQLHPHFYYSKANTKEHVREEHFTEHYNFNAGFTRLHAESAKNHYQVVPRSSTRKYFPLETEGVPFLRGDSDLLRRHLNI
jgi:hypothetical protein